MITGIFLLIYIYIVIYRLSESEIKKMREEADKYKEYDELAKKRIRKWHELEQYVYNMDDQLKDEDKMGGKLNDDDRKVFM
jgi:heat shock protein 5